MKILHAPFRIPNFSFQNTDSPKYPLVSQLLTSMLVTNLVMPPDDFPSNPPKNGVFGFSNTLNVRYVCRAAFLSPFHLHDPYNPTVRKFIGNINKGNSLNYQAKKIRPVQLLA